MKLIKLKKIVQIERKPFFITRQKLKLFRIVFNIIFVLMLFYYWSAIPLLLPRLIVVIFLSKQKDLAEKLDELI